MLKQSKKLPFNQVHNFTAENKELNLEKENLIVQIKKSWKETKKVKLKYLCLAKTNSHSKQLEKEIDESEECSRVKTAKRKIQRKLDDFQEDYENSQQEMIKLKNKIKLSNSLWNFQNDSNYTKCSFVSGEKEKDYSSKSVSKPNLEIKREESL